MYKNNSNLGNLSLSVLRVEDHISHECKKFDQN